MALSATGSELPYLLNIGQADALLYVNAFSVLVFSLQKLVHTVPLVLLAHYLHGPAHRPGDINDIKGIW